MCKPINNDIVPKQLILCYSKFRMTDFFFLIFCLQIIYRYYSIRYRKESRMLEMCLLYVKVLIPRVFHYFFKSFTSLSEDTSH